MNYSFINIIIVLYKYDIVFIYFLVILTYSHEGLQMFSLLNVGCTAYIWFDRQKFY